MNREGIILAIFILTGIAICITFGFMMELIRQNIIRTKLIRQREALQWSIDYINDTLTTCVEAYVDYDDLLCEDAIEDLGMIVGKDTKGILNSLYDDSEYWLECKINQIKNNRQ